MTNRVFMSITRLWFWNFLNTRFIEQVVYCRTMSAAVYNLAQLASELASFVNGIHGCMGYSPKLPLFLV